MEVSNTNVTIQNINTLAGCWWCLIGLFKSEFTDKELGIVAVIKLELVAGADSDDFFNTPDDTDSIIILFDVDLDSEDSSDEGRDIVAVVVLELVG